jgi:hypothetical protein
MAGRSHLLAAAALIGAWQASGPAVAEDSAGQFQDSFAGGKPELTWRAHAWWGDAVVEGEAAEDAPDGDGGIGVLQAAGEGPGAVSYAETAKAEDRFALGAQVWCPPGSEAQDGAMSGLAFFIDPGRSADPEEGGFYRLVCDYRFGDAAISLAYVGANIAREPLELERWPLVAQPAPRDAPAGWQQLEVSLEQGLMEIWLNGSKLNERPLPVERVITDIANVDAGYAGVYAGHIGEASPAEARIDAFFYRVP